MQLELSKTFRFAAGHRLPNVPPGHKCARPHGHSFRVTVTVVGELDAEAGWVMDFARIGDVVAPLIDQLDHRELNAVEGLANPTSEHIAVWLWRRIKPALPELSAVAVAESETAECAYRGG